MTVTVANRQKRRIRRRWLEQLAEGVMAAEGCHPEAELSIAIGDDEWIQELNNRYLGKNRPTDVLAFPQDLGPAGASPLLGDLAVSAETAARQAEEAGHSLEQELALLVTHGTLHLTGWTDDTAAKRRRMMQRAEELLAQARTGEARRRPR